MSDSYRELLSQADEFFEDVARRVPDQLECRRGCTMCCHGLFEISSADVSTIAAGLDQMEQGERSKLIERAEALVKELKHPRLSDSSADEKEAFFAKAEGVPCPALDESGSCVIYEHRPIVCRTFGLPLRDGPVYLGQECELNFTSASKETKERAAWDLRWEDVVGEDDQYTVPEAILIARRLEGDPEPE